MKIDRENLTENLISKALNIKDYTEIVTTFNKRNLSTDQDFQKTFNRFYVVRRNETWRRFYYDFFEQQKHRKDITFKEILYAIFEHTGKIEHSFSSKMLSTIDPNMPIWDVYILNHIGLELSGKSKNEQLENRVKLYNQIIAWYDDFLASDEGKSCVKHFDMLMPHYRWLTPTKKIDYIIWGVRN